MELPLWQRVRVQGVFRPVTGRSGSRRRRRVYGKAIQRRQDCIPPDPETAASDADAAQIQFESRGRSTSAWRGLPHEQQIRSGIFAGPGEKQVAGAVLTAPV